MAANTSPSVLLVGGGIGGMAAALALARLGLSVELLEQSASIGEIGAGLQLGPNAFAALDALGVGEAVRSKAVFTERLVMMDAVDCSEVASVQVGEAFRARFRNPYAVSHRADLHGAIFEAVQQHPRIRFHTSAMWSKPTQLVAPSTDGIGPKEIVHHSEDVCPKTLSKGMRACDANAHLKARPLLREGIQPMEVRPKHDEGSGLTRTFWKPDSRNALLTSGSRAAVCASAGVALSRTRSLASSSAPLPSGRLASNSHRS